VISFADRFRPRRAPDKTAFKRIARGRAEQDLDRACAWTGTIASAAMGKHFWIHYVDRPAGGVRHDLIEYLRELDFVLIASDVANMRRRNDLGQGQQRVVWVAHRFIFEYIDRAHAWATGLERRDERARLNQRCAARIYEQGGWFHEG